MLRPIAPSPIRSENPAPQVLDMHEAIQSNDIGLVENKSEELKRDMHSASYAGPSGMAKFLHDEWPVRKISALANDAAESFKESLYHWLPSPIASLIYGGLWLISVIPTVARVIINYQEHPKAEEKLRAGTKLLIHEGISAIAAPVVVANVTNSIQNKFYSLIKIPESIKHILRPVISFIACYSAIGFLDHPSKNFSSSLTGIVNDYHKKVNDYMEAQKPETASPLF